MTMSYEDYNKLRVIDLRALIVKHNLHNSIRRYSVMKKAQLVEVLMKHAPKTTIRIKKNKEVDSPSPPSSPEKEAPSPAKQKTPIRAFKTGQATKPKTLKPRKRTSKPKFTLFDKAMGVDRPLYSKLEGGLVEGA
jgi:hypothetical protein